MFHFKSSRVEKMTSNCQGLEVIYTNDIVRCQLCHCVSESDGKIARMDQCNHTYHIRCLIDHAYINHMICPECDKEFSDIRLSLAVAYKQRNTGAFVDILGGV
jgi:hypothetical protein